MHAGFPCFTQDIQQVMRLGTQDADVPEMLESLGGATIAMGIAVVLKLGFGYVMRDSLIDQSRSEKAMRFFEDNFVFNDPNSKNGKRYYQGKFLIRTKKPGDNMNVYLRFCSDEDDLFVDMPFGRCLNSLAVLDSDMLSESEADKIENNPDKVDLVIRFKDLNSILSLVGREDVDIVGLLLENIVQLSGNVGHLFKLGAIAKEIELELGLIPAAKN
jgi:hypothetical protein